MSKIVILAEKPSVARDIANVVGANHRMNGYLEGNNYQVTWAIGHLVSLAMPNAYGYEKWGLDYLPLIPDEFLGWIHMLHRILSLISMAFAAYSIHQLFRDDQVSRLITRFSIVGLVLIVLQIFGGYFYR